MGLLLYNNTSLGEKLSGIRIKTHCFQDGERITFSILEYLPETEIEQMYFISILCIVLTNAIQIPALASA